MDLSSEQIEELGKDITLDKPKTKSKFTPKREDKSKKTDYTLIPVPALTREAQNMQKGIGKYGKRDDWQREVIENPQRFRASLLRHTMQYLNNETDEDHLASIRCNTAILCWWEENHK